MPSTANRFRRRTRMTPAERRAQIAQAAADLISRYGSYGFPMQALADAVGMTLPGLNHYVSGREDVLALVIETYYDPDDGSFAPASDAESPEEAPSDASEGTDGTDGPDGGASARTSDETAEGLSLPAYLRGIVEANTRRPRMVALFMQLAIEAADPEHSAHRFYVERHRLVAERMLELRWRVPETHRGRAALRDLIVTAFYAMDGVQVQAMTNPDETLTDMWARTERVLFPSPIWDGYR